jgi:hypothetical protein
MAPITTPITIGLLEYRFITKHGLPLYCFLTYKDGDQKTMHLVHAIACGTDIIEILNQETIEQIEKETLANRAAGHAIATFVDMRIPQKLPDSGVRAGGVAGMNDYDVELAPEFTWRDLLVIAATVAAAVAGAVILIRRPL